MLGSIAAGVLLIPLVVLRSARHPAPVIEPALFRIRSFAVANGGMLVFSFAFYAVILANILFLTGVWGWSVLDAGLAVTPAPLMAALAAPLAGRQVGRWGPRPIAMAGALLFAAGAAWYALYLDATPDYAAEFLPGALMGGTGVGLSFASWGSAAVSELPAVAVRHRRRGHLHAAPARRRARHRRAGRGAGGGVAERTRSARSTTPTW